MTSLPKKDELGVVIDYLDEDPEVPTQKYCVVSFLSPEKIIKQKQTFMFEKFVQWQDYEWKIKGLEKFVAFLSKKYSLKIDDLLTDATDFAKVHNADIKSSDIQEQYQVFLLKNEKDLQEEYDNKVEFQTNVRGVKIRRSFPTVEEAQLFAKVFQRKYPNDNIYIGKVGAWLPWDPSEHLMPEVEYAEKELNELMRKYKENEANREIFFADQKQEAIKRQKGENARRQMENQMAALTDAPVHPSEGAIRE